TGFNSQVWSWSTDGATFTDFETVSGTNVTSFFTATLGTLNALDGASTAFVRLTVDGATSSAGNNRLDNVQFNAVPGPGALALLGLAGLAGRRRR
ncbi:MAG: putative adhesin, partial [Planctomycetota bacterium]